MKMFKLLPVMVLVLALFLSIAFAATSNELAEEYDDTDNSLTDDDSSENDEGEAFHLGGMGRFLAQRKKGRKMTCDKYPRVCHSKGSPGPHCCKKKCVDVRMDRLNCGMCGKKCKYNETCCKGKCINPSSNKKHCGGCNNKCGSGTMCVLGLCNYAN